MRLRNDNIYDFFKKIHEKNFATVEKISQKEKRDIKKYINILLVRND